MQSHRRNAQAAERSCSRADLEQTGLDMLAVCHDSCMYEIPSGASPGSRALSSFPLLMTAAGTGAAVAPRVPPACSPKSLPAAALAAGEPATVVPSESECVSRATSWAGSG